MLLFPYNLQTLNRWCISCKKFANYSYHWKCDFVPKLYRDFQILTAYRAFRDRFLQSRSIHIKSLCIALLDLFTSQQVVISDPCPYPRAKFLKNRTLLAPILQQPPYLRCLPRPLSAPFCSNHTHYLSKLRVKRADPQAQKCCPDTLSRLRCGYMLGFSWNYSESITCWEAKEYN